MISDVQNILRTILFFLKRRRYFAYFLILACCLNSEEILHFLARVQNFAVQLESNKKKHFCVNILMLTYRICV